jgi:CopG family nickel-responsive transcriptional regulator
MAIKRFGVSLDENVLLKLDKLVVEKQFPNRSQAIQHLINNSIAKEKWNKNEVVAGVITVVYDHHKRELL